MTTINPTVVQFYYLLKLFLTGPWERNFSLRVSEPEDGFSLWWSLAAAAAAA